jgi:hypothetical protein
MMHGQKTIKVKLEVYNGMDSSVLLILVISFTLPSIKHEIHLLHSTKEDKVDRC